QEAKLGSRQRQHDACLEHMAFPPCDGGHGKAQNETDAASQTIDPVDEINGIGSADEPKGGGGDDEHAEFDVTTENAEGFDLHATIDQQASDGDLPQQFVASGKSYNV